jgi:hypothetical protein
MEGKKKKKKKKKKKETTNGNVATLQRYHWLFLFSLFSFSSFI